MATLLTVEDLYKSYPPQVIFAGARFTISEKQKIGVIGRNGAGKSTLLNIITGRESADRGEIHIHDITRLGYLAQHDDWNQSESVLAYLERVTEKESWRCAKVAGKFAIKGDMLEAALKTLSGGFQMRVKLSAMLLKEPNLFFLDEPTNFLDVHTQILLEDFLRSYNGSFLIVSHDREFLRRTCTSTLEVERGELTYYPGPIDGFFDYKAERLKYAESHNKNVERERKHLQDFVDRFRYKATKAKQAQSKLKAIERLETIEVADALATVHMHIPSSEDRKGLLLRVHKAAIGYSEKIVASDITLDVDRGDKVAIVGDNGQGKTTFLKTIAEELPLLSGVVRWARNVTIAYYAQHVVSSLNVLETVWDYLRRSAPVETKREEVLRMAGSFLFNKDALEKPIGVLSGGERARLCLAGLLLLKTKVLILDEPTNHLDFETVEALARALKAFTGTVFFVSHNRTFVATVASRVLEVGGGEIKNFTGSYDDYIWNLERLAGLEERMNEEAKSKNEAVVTAVPVRTKNEISELKKQRHETEEKVIELQRQRSRLERKQREKPEKFTFDQYRDLGEVIKQIEAKETEWLAITERIGE